MPHWKYKDGVNSPIMTGAKLMPDAELLTEKIVAEENYKGVKWSDLNIPPEILSMGKEALFVYLTSFEQRDEIYINFFPSLKR